MKFKVIAKITPHPSISTAVEMSVSKDGFPMSHGVSVKETIGDSIAWAKHLVKLWHPTLSEEDINVLV